MEWSENSALSARRLRHLPPVAVPVKPRDVASGLAALGRVAAPVERLHSALQATTGSPACYLVSSGRAALTVILLGLQGLESEQIHNRTGTAEAPLVVPSLVGDRPGLRPSLKPQASASMARGTYRRTRVIVPAYGCPTVVQAVWAADLEPVLCDVSPQTLDFDPSALRRLIDLHSGGATAPVQDLLAVVAVHLYGWAQDVRPLLSLGQERGFFVLEDAAQAFGATLDGRMTGTWGHAGLYSLGRGKCLPAGRGGAIVAQASVAPYIASAMEEAVAKARAQGLADLARFVGYALATRPTGWWLVARSLLNPADEGMNPQRLPPVDLRALGPVPAAIAASILARAEAIRSVRRRNAQRLMELLAGFDFATVPTIALGAAPAFLRLPVVVDTRERADWLFNLLWRQGLGVSRSYRRSLADLFAERLGTRDSDFPGATHLATNLITLPTHGFLRDDDFARIAAALAAAGGK